MAIGLLTVLTFRWLESPPKDPNDACAIFKEKPSWYTSLGKSEELWGTPKEVQLAILFQESSFRARIRPPRTKILWVIPWRRPSSAYGYGQILDGTWQDYRRRRGRTRGWPGSWVGPQRSSFHDVADFVGWYTDQIHQTAGIEKNDAAHLYLAYHEGPGGYSRGSHRKKAWLLAVADQVAQRAQRYRQQLSHCEDALWWSALRHRLAKGAAALILLALTVLFLRRLFRRRFSSKQRRRRKR
ncbi:MAG: hypothetical protein K0U98_28170 [Deltaproteobacteria bacterium]|nr:hypothetical protein [Deltaproteobacteria bacterium]